jgi:hypothetical protein
VATKQFHISDVLSVSTGVLVSNPRLEGYYAIMGHIIGYVGINTIGLAAHAAAAKKFLEDTMPWVKDVPFSALAEGLTREERGQCVDRFVKEAATTYGAYHDVGQMAHRPDVSLAADLHFVAQVKGGNSGPILGSP